MHDIEKTLVGQKKEVDDCMRKRIIENSENWEPEIHAKPLAFYKYYDEVIIPLKEKKKREMKERVEENEN